MGSNSMRPMYPPYRSITSNLFDKDLILFCALSIDVKNDKAKWSHFRSLSKLSRIATGKKSLAVLSLFTNLKPTLVRG